MSFEKEQVDKLQEPLERRHVRERKHAGITLSYIEGWKAIEHANEIFGHDGWDRETVYTQCVYEGEREGGKSKYASAYVAKVRITVRAGGITVVREGTGSGSGFGQNPGEAHESAIKEAETDAMKRALMTFGWKFGLALYDKGQEHVVDQPLTDEEAEEKVETSLAGLNKVKPADRDPQKELSDWADRALGADVQKRLSLAQRKALSKTRAMTLVKVEEIYKEMGEEFSAQAWTAKMLGVPADAAPEHLSPLDSGVTDEQLREMEREAKSFLARVKERAAEAMKTREG